MPDELSGILLHGSHEIAPVAGVCSELRPVKRSLQLWRQMVGETRTAPLSDRIKAVNSFFNRLQYIEDRYMWGEENYWATLHETLEQGGGDCEDLTLAKYFTFLRLGVPDHRMRITYAISLKTRKPHMVLAFFRAAGADPLILDTKDNLVFPVSRRNDLVPVYSFNRLGYWLAEKKKEWRGEKIGSAARLSLWRHVLQRMNAGG